MAIFSASNKTNVVVRRISRNLFRISRFFALRQPSIDQANRKYSFCNE